MIRRARPADAAAIEPLSAALMHEEQIAVPPALRDGIDRLLAEPGLGFILVAEHDGAVVAHAVCTYGFDLEFAGRDAWLTEVFVAEDHRAGGLGRALVAEVEREAAANSVRALHLQVRAENPARRLYDRAGFTGVPRLLMSKRL